jgi:hypothetical protein
MGHDTAWRPALTARAEGSLPLLWFSIAYDHGGPSLWQNVAIPRKCDTSHVILDLPAVIIARKQTHPLEQEEG